MTPPSYLTTLSKTLLKFLPQRNVHQSAIRLLFVCGMLTPISLLANSLGNFQDGTFSAQVTLYEWPDSQTVPIPELEQLGDQRIQTLLDDAAKQAQANYLAKKYRQKPKDVRKFVDLAWAEAEKRNGDIKPELLIAIMQKESSLRPKVQNRYGAQGLMQVVRRWHREKLHPSESLFDPAVNIRVATDILEEYLASANGSLTKALVKYSGNARGYSKKILKESLKLAQMAEQATINSNTAQAQVASDAG